MALQSGIDEGKLDFAYRFPFSNEAKEIASGIEARLDERFLKLGGLRLTEALNDGKVRFSKIGMTDLKFSSLMSYIYARMLLSAVYAPWIASAFAKAEASRALECLAQESPADFARIAVRLGVDLLENREVFSMRFEDFLEYSRPSNELKLIRQRLSEGFVYMDRQRAAKVVGIKVEREVIKNLPIERRYLYPEVLAYSKTLKIPEHKIKIPRSNGSDGAKYAWIEKLLDKPIPDVRHRTVNLILAPYLTNVKGLGVNEAAEVIREYIERCKQIEPNTNVNQTYIAYQCRYAKEKGMKPLSLERAKEMLKGLVEL